MTLLARSLFLGYGSAAALSFWLLGSGPLPVAVLAGWLGGAILSLVLAGIGMLVLPERVAAEESAEAEFRKWDEDLAQERSMRSSGLDPELSESAAVPDHPRAAGSAR